MKDNEVKPWHILVFMSLVSVTIFFIYSRPQVVYKEVETICKCDSLQTLVYQLESELKIEEDGWDDKENRYESILFEYEYGLSQMKEKYPNAYREFHRIIAFREKYDRQIERENKIRLKSNKW